MSSLQDITLPLETDQCYHIYNRGNAGQLIFLQEKNYVYFLQKYKEYMLSYWDTYAYALLPNHFHLMIKVRSEEQLIEAAAKDFSKVSQNFVHKFMPNPKVPKTDLLNFKKLATLARNTPEKYNRFFRSENVEIFYQKLLQWIVSERFRRFLLSYAKAIRKQEKNEGSLFQKLYRRKVVEHIDYQRQLVLYLHRNYIHHGYAVDLSDENWTSYHSMLTESKTDLKRTEVLNWFGGKDSFRKIHEQYVDDWRESQKWMIEEE